MLRQKFQEFTYFFRFPDKAPAIGVPPAHWTKSECDILRAGKLLEKGGELARIGKLDMFRNLGIELFKEDGGWKHSSSHHRLSFQQGRNQSLLVQSEFTILLIELDEKPHLSEIERGQSDGLFHDRP